jgi:hypothetical protein
MQALPVAASLAPATRERAATSVAELALARDTTLGPAMRAAGNVYGNTIGVRVGVFPAGPGLILPQLGRSVQNDSVATRVATLNVATQAGIVATGAVRGAWRFRLEHHLGEYNAVQRVFFYWGALGLVALILLSGVANWKPVQTYPSEVVFGDFQGARIVHFLGMSAIVAFLVVHVALVILVPRTFIAMVTGRAAESVPHARMETMP